MNKITKIQVGIWNGKAIAEFGVDILCKIVQMTYTKTSIINLLMFWSRSGPVIITRLLLYTTTRIS
jgi:hypothetical protein